MEHQSDFLVIGSGVAGLSFALKAAEHGSVALITKKTLMDSNTAQAQGGIASVFGKIDSFDLHIEDTLKSGDGLCNPEVVAQVVKGGPDRIRELMELGVQFNLKAESAEGSPTLDLTKEGGHSRNRIVHAQDMTGRELVRALLDHVREHPNITIFTEHIAVDLITYSTRLQRGVVTTSHKEQCCGAYVLDRQSDKVVTFRSQITLIACGGAGKVYLYTSNPDVATGDGIAMGYRAGATIANMEFVQFHPTCLYHPEAKNFLISEAVRGEGGLLLDVHGHRFMEKYAPEKELACRDVVARAIDAELKRSGEDCVFLDISHKSEDFVKKRFPNLMEKCLTFGFDMTREPIPVVPAAHYMCGGILVDQNGGCDIRRLYTVGESSCTGLHGANRLASNSLIEALVYADRSAAAAISELKSLDPTATPQVPLWDEMETTSSDELIMVSHNWDEIRRLMWNYVGIVRSNKRLSRADRRIKMIQKEIREYYWDFHVSADLIELRNIATVAELIVQCAKQRKESRGLHFTLEYPDHNDEHFLKDTLIRRPITA